MQKIDAHQHFWKYDAIRDSWITPDMAVLQKDFLPSDLQPLLEANDVAGCVAVQADQSEAETLFLVNLAASHSFIKGVVGWVDLQADTIMERLQYFQQYGFVKGFRHILQGETDRALMLSPRFKNGIKALGEFNYSYDLLILTDQLIYAKELVAAFPDQKFIIDHLAKPNIKEKEVDGWMGILKEVAQYPNVYCKLSGMVTEAHWKTWTKADFTPYLDAVVEAFGTSRVVYGSDWPVCLVAASYTEQLHIVSDYFSTFSEVEQKQVFSENAIQFYNLI